jgi:dCTP deaminase
MILSDVTIRKLIKEGKLGIEPIHEDTIRENGVDLRFGNEFCLVKKQVEKVIDTKHTHSPYPFFECTKVSEEEGFVVPPARRVLATTLEYIRLPPDIIGLVNLRSTYARLGLYIPPTIVDAGFEGELTIELVGSDSPIRIYPGQRFLHLVFARLDTPTSKPYSGSYKRQRGVRLPTLPVR